MAEIRVDDLESLRHDPLCPAPGSTVHGCICVELRERDARVRADERARELQASRETALTIASNVAALERHHVEAVAARLVEVICRQEQQIDDLVEHVGDFASDVLVLTGERDAARVDLDSMAVTLDIARAERDAARAEVAEEIAQAIERTHAGAMTQYRMERSTYWEGSTDAYDTAARIARQIGGAS